MTIRVTIDPRVAARWPHVTVRGFQVSSLAEATLEPPSTEDVLAALALAGVNDTDTLATHPLIAGWRSAIGDCGLKASRYRSSAEALARRFLRNGGLATPVPAVDVYCGVSAKHLAPLGAYDLNRLPARQVDLRFAAAGDSFDPLGGDASSMPLKDTVAVYAAADTVLCWAFNHRDSATTSLVPGTNDAIFLGEAVTPAQANALESALRELRERLEKAGVQVGDDVHVE